MDEKTQPMPKPADLDVPLDSVAIKRLIEEVLNEQAAPPGRYNRIYNRHNR